MNKKDIVINKNNTLELVKRNSLFRTSINNSKCWKSTTRNHFLTISEIMWILVNKYGFDTYSEVEFQNGSRADIFYIDNNGFGGIVEILDSESEKRFSTKLEKYPLPITRVDTKTFDGESWKL